MSKAVKALFPLSHATIRLSAITAINTAMTNVLLAALVFKKSNPKPEPNTLIKVFKDASIKTMDNVMRIAEDCKLNKAEIEEIKELTKTYKSILEVLE